MAKDRAQRKAKDKWKEKKWYSITAPDYLGGKEISYSVGNEPETMVGRKIEVPVSDFTGNFKRANAKMIFKVLECQGSKCSSEFVGHSLSDDYIRRMVRRRKERIDVIKGVKTNDDVEMVLKVVLVTDGKLTTSKRSDVRKAVEAFLTEKSATMPYGEIAKYVIGDEVYGDIVNATKDIYPIRKIEVRKSVLASSKPIPKQAVPEPQEEEEEKEEEPAEDKKEEDVEPEQTS